MGSKQLVLGNLVSIAVTVMAFLQVLPWQVAGGLVLVFLVVALLPIRVAQNGRMSEGPGTGVGRPVRPSVERPTRVTVGLEKEAVKRKPEAVHGRVRQVAVKPTARNKVEDITKIGKEPVRIGEGDYASFEVELGEGEEFVGVVSASGMVNVYVLTEDNLTNFDADGEFWYEAGSEGVESTTTRFTAPEEGEWFFVVENVDNGEVEVKLGVSVNRPSHGVPLLKAESLGLPSEKLEGKL